MRSHLTRLERRVDRLTCPACGRRFVATTAAEGEDPTDRDRLTPDEWSDLTALSGLMSVQHCPRCERATGFEASVLSDAQLDRIVELASRLWGTAPLPKLTGAHP